MKHAGGSPRRWSELRRGPTAAQIIDFKTDRDAAGAMARAERYRPQLDAYRTALARILRLPPERISARLAFVADDTIVEV